MRYVKYLILVFTLFSITSFAQTRATSSVVDENSRPSGIYRVDATPLLEQYYKRNGLEPEKFSMPPVALRKTTAWNFKVGDTKTFKLADLSPSGVTYSSSFTCRKVGTNCYIFVEDSLWTSRVDQNGVDSVQVAFDSKTPANKSKGIYQTDTDVFGNPPDVDNDPKIIILIHNIKDGFTGSGGYVAGFFSPNDETGANGNSPSEIYHMDANPLNLKTTYGLQVGLSTAAHEFQHMIHYNFIKTATTFFNEGFSLTAEVINGYGVYDQSGYAGETNHSLLPWRTNDDAKVLNDYSRAARFFLYVYEQFGSQLFTKYLKQGFDGIMGFNFILSSLGSTRTYTDVVSDWFIANIVNNKNVKAEWGYTYPNLTAVTARSHTNPNLTYDDKLMAFGVQYITFSNGKNLSINFTDKEFYGIKIKAVKFGTGNPVVQDVTAGTTYNVADFGTTYPKVTFAVYYADLTFQTATIPYSYTATGTGVSALQEISYDTKEPMGIINLPAGDSVAVAFNGVAGAKLDSIRVAVRTLSTINGGLYKYNSAFNSDVTKPVGSALLAPLSGVGKIYNTTPYPIPWNNWCKFDVRSKNIDAGNAFVAEFAVEGTYQAGVSTGPNRVMFTYQPSSSSLSYSTSGESRRWYNFYVDKDAVRDSFYTYLIRAYVTIGTVGIDGPVEILPSKFALDQNYPNPFNPSTIISYNLPKQSTVQIKIYDAIGNEVRSLINEDKLAGKYNILWDGRNNAGNKVSSGVYYYRITAGDFVQTKKMMLMK
jgi:hypothetical protein